MKNSTLHKGFNKFPQDERLVEFPSSCEGFLLSKTDKPQGSFKKVLQKSFTQLKVNSKPAIAGKLLLKSLGFLFLYTRRSRTLAKMLWQPI